jgi:pimeloyl-ACP methyl ester carboxylesterase
MVADCRPPATASSPSTTIWSTGSGRPRHVDSEVVTSFGTTRAHRLGSGKQTPLVLLPGSGGPSLMWHTYLGRRAASRPVTAIDPVGEPGPSVQTRAIDNGDEWSQWLDEVLAALDVGQAHLVGTSYGGWIALRHALRSPDAVVSLALLDPGGFGKVSPKFVAWVIACGLASFAPRPIRHALARLLRNLALRDDEAMPLVKATFGVRRRHVLPTPAHRRRTRTDHGTDAGAGRRPQPALRRPRGRGHDHRPHAACRRRDHPRSHPRHCMERNI